MYPAVVSRITLRVCGGVASQARSVRAATSYIGLQIDGFAVSSLRDANSLTNGRSTSPHANASVRIGSSTVTPDARDVEVRVQYVADCPHRQLAEQRARAALDNIGRRDVTLIRECVRSADDAVRFAFRGSPTVLVNGHDLFPDPGGAISLSCRRYLTEQGIEGAPSVAQLTAALALIGGA